MQKITAVIPAYNESATIRDIAERTLQHCDQLIVVDDGSSDDTYDQLKDLPIVLIKNETNLGKATSLWKGMLKAIELGANAIITLDADGQHLPEDIPKFVNTWLEDQNTLVIGSRMANKENFPRSRLVANQIANFWISWAAGQKIEDSQCGFRLYPVDLLKKLDIKLNHDRGFVFESEVIIKAAKYKYYTVAVPIDAIYEENARPSHFQGGRDITQITKMVAKSLIFRGLYPVGLFRVYFGKQKKKQIKYETGPESGR